MRPHNETHDLMTGRNGVTIPGTGRRSSKETAKDRAAELHLRNHAASTLPWRRWSRLRLGLGESGQKLRGLDAPTTTNFGCQYNQTCPTTSPDSSGNVASFLLLALCSAAPSWLALLEADPSRERCETNVVSIASCAPRHKLKPSSTTSNLRPSKTFNSPRSMQ